MLSTVDQAPASTSALLKAEWSPQTRAKRDSAQSQLQQETSPGSRLAANDGAIVEWTEADGVLGLGYPVPVPVDTPLPFDGFRSYNGLHTRHQDLMATTDIVHGEVVGTTHHGREIWAYRIGDADLLTRDGLPEPATLTNGGIHAREWQTPEVVTGIMEMFAERQGDHHFYDFLLENVNMVLVPVQNVDGFVQTQRYPTQNWLYTDPFDLANDPQPSPRDGRMRRKNMLDADELLATSEDHLLGVDLNRNNPPLWSLNLNRSSPDNRSLVYYGPAAHSEPETQALLAAGALGPTAQLQGLHRRTLLFAGVLFPPHRQPPPGRQHHQGHPGHAASQLGVARWHILRIQLQPDAGDQPGFRDDQRMVHHQPGDTVLGHRSRTERRPAGLAGQSAGLRCGLWRPGTQLP